jgi:hypothetical protein
MKIEFVAAVEKPPWQQTVLHDIAAIHVKSYHTEMQRFWLQRKALRWFGRINDWRYIDGGLYFPFKIDVTKYDLFDHVVVFDKALIAEPFTFRDWRGDGKAIAARHGLAFHTPPYPAASIYRPRQCAFLAFTRPSHIMKWLPEQVSGIAGGVTS